MMHSSTRAAAIVALTLWIGAPSWAQPVAAKPPESAPYRYGRHHVDHVINDDLTSTETRSWSMKVLDARVLEWAKRASVSYSTSVQKVEVIDAYTLKGDGQRIDVPKGNYQVNINRGRETGGPVFSDFSSLAVVFPDLAVGDTVVFSYRIAQSEPIFPGHFDTGGTFTREIAYDDVRVRIEYPAALAATFESRQMQTVDAPKQSGRNAVEWRWSNPTALRSTRTNYSAYNPDKEVGYAFSTFAGHASIAAAYGVRASPKAAVTDRIKKLADEIVGSHQEPRQQARSIYDWVATTITYGGNCVGVGTVVPRDLDFVLDNRMGDCKDHATLLQALLAARGITSQQALVNASNQYELPRIPLVSSVNHVINFIPSLNLFVDATSSSTPFGSLPLQLRGKPVLLVGSNAAAPRLPVPRSAGDQRTVSTFKIAADGSMSGSVEALYTGDAAIATREWARQMPKDRRDDAVKDLLRSMRMQGQGTLDMDDPTALLDTYRIKLNLTRVDKFVRSPGQGAFHIEPMLGGLTVGRFAVADDVEPIEHDSACSNGKATEIYTIELPKGMKVSSLPKSTNFANSVQRFEASYQLKGQVLHVRRVAEDTTPTAVCTPATLTSYRTFGGKLMDHLEQQVLYK